jgi:D-alanine-D-alanine ligase
VKRKRVLILVREGLEPPENTHAMSKEEIINAPWKTEYDVAVTLEELGHEVRVLGIYDKLAALRDTIHEFKPHIIFNLLEEFAGEVQYDHRVVTYLEMLKIPCTGCNPKGLMISRDKVLTKKLLAYHRIRVPHFSVFPVRRRIRRPKRLQFPLFVKSVVQDASFGIAQASLVKNDAGLVARVSFIHEQTGTDAIAEEFIEGRELYVGVIGNKRLETFPVWELFFEKQPEDRPIIATARAKWNSNYQKKWGITSRKATDIPNGLYAQIEGWSKRIYRILGLSGYARFDFRLTPEGVLYFLEANPNPQLAYGEDFAESAEQAGISYHTLLRRIISLGLRSRSHAG